MPPVLEALISQAQLEHALALGALLLARLFPLGLLVPWLRMRQASLSWSLTIVIALAVALYPTAVSAAPATLPSDPLALAVLAVREVAVGALYALGLSLPLYALGWGGRLIDAMRGARARAHEASPLGQLYLWLGLAAFFALGGHRVALSLLGDGLLRHPPGAAANVSWAKLALGSAGLVADALTLAIMVAIPIALALLLLELTMGAIARSGAALAVDGMLVPARAALGLGFALLGAAVLVGELPAIFQSSLRAFSGMLGSGP